MAQTTKPVVLNETMEEANRYLERMANSLENAGIPSYIKEQIKAGFLRGNLIPFPYYLADRTSNGITYTSNSDGTINASGTSTATSNAVLIGAVQNITIDKNKQYALIGGKSSTVRIRFQTYKGGSVVNTYLTNDEKPIRIDDLASQDFDSIQIQLYIHNGVTLNNVTFYPMLVEVAEDGTYPTEYIPYSGLSNRELTDKALAIPSTDYLTDSKTYHTNELFIYNNKAYKVKSADNGILGSAIKSSLSTYADETTLGSEFGGLNNNLSNKLTAATGGIGGATDLNTLMDTGFYTANGATSINKPSDLSSIKGGLIVIKSASDRILQIIVSDGNILYSRLYNGTWGEWNKNNKLKKKSVSKAFSTSNQSFADADLYNRDYVDAYITCSSTSELNRMVRVYRDTNVGFTVSYGASDYRLNVKLSFSNNSNGQGVVTYGCVSGQCVGWNANIITLSTVYYN